MYTNSLAQVYKSKRRELPENVAELNQKMADTYWNRLFPKPKYEIIIKLTEYVISNKIN